MFKKPIEKLVVFVLATLAILAVLSFFITDFVTSELNLDIETSDEAEKLADNTENNHETGNESGLILKIQEQIDHVIAKSFPEMVPDSIVRSIARGFFGRPIAAGPKTWAAGEGARRRVLHNELYSKLPQVQKCNWPFCYKEKVRPNTLNLSEAEEHAKNGRRILLQKAKDYLSSHDNLWAFYEAKKPIVLDELRVSLESRPNKDERLSQLKNWLSGLSEAIKAIEHPRFRSIYIDYLEAEQELASDCHYCANYFDEEGVSVNEKYRSGYGIPLNSEYMSKEIEMVLENSKSAFMAFCLSEKELKSLTPDLDATLFAARRHAENPELPASYLEIILDFQKELKAL